MRLISPDDNCQQWWTTLHRAFSRYDVSSSGTFHKWPWRLRTHCCSNPPIFNTHASPALSDGEKCWYFCSLQASNISKSLSLWKVSSWKEGFLGLSIPFTGKVVIWFCCWCRKAYSLAGIVRKGGTVLFSFLLVWYSCRGPRIRSYHFFRSSSVSTPSFPSNSWAPFSWPWGNFRPKAECWYDWPWEE